MEVIEQVDTSYRKLGGRKLRFNILGLHLNLMVVLLRPTSLEILRIKVIVFQVTQK